MPKPKRSRVPGSAPDERTSTGGWTHVASGLEGPEAAMVDVSAKAVTRREAVAEALVRFPAGLLDELLAGRGPKGPILETARTAGILAAKRTGELIPLCHPLGLDFVEVRFARRDEERLEIRSRAACTGRTGVEMEALVAATVAALTVYDMSKAKSHAIELEHARLLEKRGGRSGHWVRPGSDGS